jgi:hypothetical protein
VRGAFLIGPPWSATAVSPGSDDTAGARWVSANQVARVDHEQVRLHAAQPARGSRDAHARANALLP